VQFAFAALSVYRAHHVVGRGRNRLLGGPTSIVLLPVAQTERIVGGRTESRSDAPVLRPFVITRGEPAGRYLLPFRITEAA
jgi:hypothetical protein